MYDFDSIREEVINIFEDSEWVRWIHEGTPPAYTQTDKDMNLVYAAISRHCAKCMNLNGCCFPKNNVPISPLHPKCHCWLMPVSVNNIQFEATSDMRKFDKYAFIHKTERDKKGLFEKLGYDIMDSPWLLDEYCRQAQEKYANGDFTLRALLDQGQTIRIAITLPNKKTGGEATIRSGWMVYPDGEIKLTTVFTGWEK